MTSTMRFDKWENSLGQPYGTILQVVSVEKTDSFASSVGAVWGDVSGLSVTITPKFINSKMLILADVKGAGTQDNSIVRSKIVKGIGGVFSDIGVGNAAGNRPRVLGQFYISSGGAGIYYLAQIGGNVLDTPNTLSPITYKVQIGADANDRVVRVNMTQGERDTAYYDGRGYSSLTVMEIAQ
jgi:hypothetical protein